jgi:hypothetical protein
MKTFAYGLALASIVYWELTACFAQNTSGRATLEDLINADQPKNSVALVEPEVTAAVPTPPAGVVARPKDGVKHPDLDRAWAVYDAAVSKVAAGVRAAITKQFDAATSKGDLDAVLKWQHALDRFEATGELPAEKETKAAINTAVADYRKSREELALAYEPVVKALTMEKKIAEARAARDESRDLASNADPAREFSVTIHLTSDWGSVALHPASAVEIGKQAVAKGGGQWKVSENRIELRGQPFRRNDSTVTFVCRLKGAAKELLLETHKGDIGALYVEAMHHGELLGRFPNEGNHGGNAQRSDFCRRDFKLVLQ